MAAKGGRTSCQKYPVQQRGKEIKKGKEEATALRSEGRSAYVLTSDARDAVDDDRVAVGALAGARGQVAVGVGDHRRARRLAAVPDVKAVRRF